MLQTSEETPQTYTSGAPSPDWITPGQVAGVLNCDDSYARTVLPLVSWRRKPASKRRLYRADEVRSIAEIIEVTGLSIRAAAKVMAALRDGRLRW